MALSRTMLMLQRCRVWRRGEHPPARMQLPGMPPIGRNPQFTAEEIKNDRMSNARGSRPRYGTILDQSVEVGQKRGRC